MTSWRDTAQVAAEEWVWVPPDADQRLTEEYQLVAYPERFAVPTVLTRCRSERSGGDLLAEAAQQVREWGRRELSVWVSELSSPPDLVAALVAAGAEHVESVDVLAADLSRPPRDLGTWDVQVVRVTSIEDLRRAEALAAEVFGEEPPGEEELTHRHYAITGSRSRPPSEIRVLALDGDEAVATGGCTVTGGIARLWGAATVEWHRGRGAYRAVLSERLRLAAGLGANLALVKGLTQTSSPILRRMGFTHHGSEHRYRLAL